MAIRILEIDRPTNKGTIYPRAVVEKAIALYMDKAGQLGSAKMGIFKGIDIVKEDMIGYADNIRIEDGWLVADVSLVDKWVNEMASLNRRNFGIRPIGKGIINPETGIVEEGYVFYALTIRFPPAVQYEKN